jgi:hypothetical protein
MANDYSDHASRKELDAMTATKEDPGRVSINRNSDHPEAKDLPYPTNRVVGLVNSEDTAWRVVERLKSDGFEDNQLELFFGEAGQDCLHNYHAPSGLLGHVAQIAESLGSEQDQSRAYEEALANGQVLVAIKAPQGDVDKIQEALSQEGANSLRYYGRLNIRDLGQRYCSTPARRSDGPGWET